MMPNKVSKFARRLRELGCTPYDEILSRADLEETTAFAEMATGRPIPWSSQKQRKRLVAQKILPAFQVDLIDPALLFVVDEIGADWRGPVDIREALLRLGFNDMDIDPRFVRMKSEQTFH